MAIIATSNVVYDGTRNVSLLLTGVCDGFSGNETATLKVDVSSYMPVGGKVNVQAITYDITNGSGDGTVTLAWEAFPANVTFAVLHGHHKFDFSAFGGLVNLADVETATGNILLTTSSFEAGAAYTILLEMTKK